MGTKMAASVDEIDKATQEVEVENNFLNLNISLFDMTNTNYSKQ